jgi:UDPglucose 6-dehydrogenase
MHLADSALSAADASDALVVATPWPEYRKVAAQDVAARMARPLVLDAGRFLDDTLGRQPEIEYFSVGRTAR